MQASEWNIRMPTDIITKCLNAAENAIRVFFGRNIAQCKCIGGEQAWRDDFRRDGENDIARVVHLFGKEVIGFFVMSPIGHLHQRMIVAQFTEQDIETSIASI